MVSERGTDARDNGFYMFRYMRVKHPELEVYYVIDKDSVDRRKIVQYGNIIDRGSLRHKILYAVANFKISTHAGGTVPYLFCASRVKSIFYRHGKFINIKHGITKDNLPEHYAENAKFDLFICGGKPEYEYISKNFHYSSEQVKYTGFARYDALHDLKMKNQILVMPTWRKFVSRSEQSEFLKSDYFNKWNSLASHKRMKNAFIFELINGR